MNRILFSLLAISTILFSGCSLSEPSPQDVDRASSENIQKIRQGKTFFGFLKTPSIPLSPNNSTEVVTVTVSPTYEPISSVSLALQYDSNLLAVSDIIPAENIHPILLEDQGKIIRFTGIFTPPALGENLPLFSFHITAKSFPNEKQTSISFLPNELTALLPDADNTETAVRTNLPQFSIAFSQ